MKYGGAKAKLMLKPTVHRHKGRAIETDHLVKNLSDQSTLRKKMNKGSFTHYVDKTLTFFLTAYPPLLTFSTL